LQTLNLKCDYWSQAFAFKCNLYHYTAALVIPGIQRRLLAKYTGTLAGFVIVATSLAAKSLLAGLYTFLSSVDTRSLKAPGFNP
jgi:hypothetical protein